MAYSDYLIPLSEGTAQTRAWQSAYPSAPAAFRIDRKELEDMLAVPGTEYVRAYSGLDSHEAQTMVLVCVDSDGNDMYNIVIGEETISGAFNFTRPCPPLCGSISPFRED